MVLGFTVVYSCFVLKETTYAHASCFASHFCFVVFHSFSCQVVRVFPRVLSAPYMSSGLLLLLL